MYNIKQISIYCLLSFLLSLIITTFYVKKLNKQYYFVFILLFIVFYLFFYLMNLENKEDFDNFSYYVEGYDKLYESTNKKTHNKHNLSEEEEHRHHNLTQEEEHIIHQEEQNNTPEPVQVQEEETEKEYQIPITRNNVDLEKLSIKNSVKGNTCSPVNINIYNGEVENQDNKKMIIVKNQKI